MQVVEVDGVDVKIVKSRRAKRLSININCLCEVRVSVPWRYSFKAAKEFLNDNSGWIKKNLEKVSRLRKNIENVDEGIDFDTAKQQLTERLGWLADLYGFEYNRVFIRRQKTRWGSCSGVNNINLNVNLVRLDQRLMDYVLLHELVHTRVKNHSLRFWRELDRYTSGQAKELDKQLRKYWI